MKKQALSALVLVGLGMATSQVFADGETQSPATERPARRMGTGTVNESAKRGQERGMEFKQFLRTDLTAQETATLTGVLESNRSSMRSLSDSMKSGTITRTEFDTQAKALRESFKNVIVGYVAADKVDEFYAEFAKLPTVPQAGANGKEDEARKRKNATGFGQIEKIAKKTKTKALLQEFKILLQKKIDALDDDVSTDDSESIDAIFQ